MRPRLPWTRCCSWVRRPCMGVSTFMTWDALDVLVMIAEGPGARLPLRLILTLVLMPPPVLVVPVSVMSVGMLLVVLVLLVVVRVALDLLVRVRVVVVLVGIEQAVADLSGGVEHKVSRRWTRRLVVVQSGLVGEEDALTRMFSRLCVVQGCAVRHVVVRRGSLRLRVARPQWVLLFLALVGSFLVCCLTKQRGVELLSAVRGLCRPVLLPGGRASSGLPGRAVRPLILLRACLLGRLSPASPRRLLRLVVVQPASGCLTKAWQGWG